MTMKKLLAAISVTLILVLGVSVAFAADSYYGGTREGVVVSSSAALRVEPHSKADKVGTLQNADTITVVGESGSFYIVDIEQTEFGDDGAYKAYVDKDYILLDAYYLELPVKTKILVAPYLGAKANGEKVAGTKMLVLADIGDWLAVQCRESTAGSSFIHKSWLNGNSYNGGSSWNSGSQSGSSSMNQGSRREAVVTVPQSLRVRKEAHSEGETLGFLHTGDRVYMVGSQIGDFQGIEYEYCGATVVAYVTAKYLMAVHY